VAQDEMKTFKPWLSLVCILEMFLRFRSSFHLNGHHASACLFDPRQNPIEFTIVYLHPWVLVAHTQPISDGPRIRFYPHSIAGEKRADE
jgi:hypothetical protein